jgi:hypothetical protein
LAKKRTTEQMVEIHEYYIIKSVSGSLPALCTECAANDAVMISPEQAAILKQVPVRTIYRQVELGAIHYKEAADGTITVCTRSLGAEGKQVI